MADETEDTTEFDEMSAAEFLAEQRRLENEALELARPAQEAEAELLRGLSQVAPVGAGQYEYGTVMPTSRGFMYVGKGVPGPEPGTPLAATREFESAVTRQNYPAAAAASEGLVSMGLQRPGEFVPFPRQHPYNPPDAAAMRFAGQQEFLDAVNSGVPTKEAADKYLPAMLTSASGRGSAFAPMSPYQQVQTGLRAQQTELAQQIHADRLAQQARKEATTVPLWVSERYKTLLKAEEKASEGMDPEEKNRARWEREGFEREHFGGKQPTIGVAAPAASVAAPPLVAPPAAAPTAAKAAALPSKKSALVKGQLYSTKQGNLVWNGTQFVRP